MVKNRIINEDQIVDVEEIRKEKQDVKVLVEQILEIKRDKVNEFVSEVDILDENILEQIPAEKPKWFFSTPKDKKNETVYFVGESYGEKKYENAYEDAKVSSMVELCQFIKKQVDVLTSKVSSTVSNEKTTKIIQRIASISKNTFMRESKVVDRYYIKLKPTKKIPFVHYKLFVLVAFPKKNVDDATKESLIYEKELLRGSMSEEDFKKMEGLIDEIASFSKQKEMMTQIEKERRMLFEQYKIENLYARNELAESNEAKGRLQTAYRQYLEVLARIKPIIEKQGE